jgi:hypothetical protein
MANEDEEGISMEEIIIEMLEAQIEVIQAVSSGKPLADAENLTSRLQDLRDLLEQAVMEPDDE